MVFSGLKLKYLFLSLLIVLGVFVFSQGVIAMLPCDTHADCDVLDGCNNGYYDNWQCGAGACYLHSSTCTESCCVAHYGAGAFCSGGVCHAPPAEPYCGDGVCEGDETVWNCCGDCGVPVKHCQTDDIRCTYSCPADGTTLTESCISCSETFDGCSNGRWRTNKCSEGNCVVDTITCTEACCDEYHGDTDAFCENNICNPPPGGEPVCGDGVCSKGHETVWTCCQDCTGLVGPTWCDPPDPPDEPDIKYWYTCPTPPGTEPTQHTEDCGLGDGCSLGYDQDWTCSAGECVVVSAPCTEPCCDLHHGDIAAFCLDNVCHAPPGPDCDNDGTCDAGEHCGNCPADCGCATCYYCHAETCVARPDGFNDCGAGCQRCLGGACIDFDIECPGHCNVGYRINLNCVNDVCTGSACTNACCDVHHGDSAAFCLDNVCHAPPGAPCYGVTCPACQYCDPATGNCVHHAGGFNDCGAGCQRCLGGACIDFDIECFGHCNVGYRINLNCVNDVCTGSICTNACCDVHHGDSAAFCLGGVCHAPKPICDNDGICEAGENCANCPADCGCATCYYCNAEICVVRADGFNDCGAGCQRCVGGACTDWDAACPGTCSAGYEINFDCVSDVCTGSKCTKPCCVAHYGTGAFCDGGVCHPPNEPPVASIECDGTYCDTVGCLAYTGCVFHFLNNSTDPDGQDDIVLSEWDIIGWGAEPDLKCVPPNALCNYTPPTAILTPGIYTVTLLVEDLFGASDTHSITWTLRREALALFECSLDNITWLACDDPGFRPFQGERAYFKDNSSPSENGVSIVSRTWRKNGAVFDDNNNPNPFIALTEAPTIITLTVTDNKGRTDSQSYEIVVRMPLPEWWEVAPIGWLRKFLTGAVDFVNSF